VRAVDQVALRVATGDFLIITGRSGSGKTTLLSLIGGLTIPTSGADNVFDKYLAELDDAAISTLRAERIGFVFQFASLIPTLTALDNVRLPGLFAKSPVSPEEAARLLSWVGLANKLANYPAQLSGGQQARVTVARALANQPDLLLADEPTGNLDVETEREILELFRELNMNDGTTVVLVTHNPELACYGNRHLIMADGRLNEVYPWSQLEVMARG
jgi:ABC-type lipoprotein export system ATPase subunit